MRGHPARMTHTRRSYALAGLGVDGPTVRLIAVEAAVDPRSVVIELRAQRGEAQPVRGDAGNRIRRALALRGLPSPAGRPPQAVQS
jgi:hypothetical protein